MHRVRKAQTTDLPKQLLKTFKIVNIFFTIVGISVISFTYFNIGFQNLVILCYVELT